MGNEVSGEEDDGYYNDEDDDYAKQFDGIETLGYRVLGVQPDSPGKFWGSVCGGFGAYPNESTQKSNRQTTKASNGNGCQQNTQHGTADARCAMAFNSHIICFVPSIRGDFDSFQRNSIVRFRFSQQFTTTN
jgi:hypothetical protein